MKVCKFGGTSLADAAAIGRACDIVCADPERRIMVVSAPGKRNKKDRKITDLLIDCAEARLAGKSAEEPLAAVAGRFVEIRRGLGLPESLDAEIAADLHRRLGADTSHRARFVDGLKAGGEDLCARLVAAEFRRRGVAAAYRSPKDAGLLLSDEYGNARMLPQSHDNLASLAAEKGIVVFPGFFGYTVGGEVVTFPRGGSDITGSILAAAVKADLYENFTDVDSVMAADPGIVPDAAPIAELTYREMRELSYAGFGVLHEEAIMPAVLAGIPICVRNTNRLEAPGTRIVRERDHTPGRAVGIASAEGFCTIFVDKYLMNREIGFGRRFLQILEEEGVSYEHMPSGIDNVSVILREERFDREMERRVVARIQAELEPEDVEVERGLALIMIVGEGMRYAVGMAARATGALSRAGVNIEMMNQGSSEISMMFGVKDVDRKRAVRSLYDAFFPA
jgi:aspartate kinase